MKYLALFMTLLLCTASAVYAGQEQTTAQENTPQVVYRGESQKSFKGPEDLFTGDVQVDLLFPANDTAHYSGAYVTFQPGARTNWHFHPAGQHMIVTSGIGLTGTRDGKVIEFKAGDTIWCPPDIDHWHGATPDSPMTHLVITGDLNGENVIWKEKVTDEQYNARKE
ncbi:cupin domain-containing protein [Oceanidesulfovibrio marinus]|uniref:Cupin domain-containing protein n=1 Tax=Oceanidesulfovibrio marinus TaxID=370038 RepID=A0A6P1ZCY1_9BACT|nr:cupin domain-containing protein [Oceanidesulfovibrio marinus]TVM32119.1 cupin domain-containing protein [Oceanidesulfovibrio marinus]